MTFSKTKILGVGPALSLAASFHLSAGDDVAPSVTTKATKTPNPFSQKEWWDGPSLSYGQFGRGATMREHGVYLESTLTQFEQGLTSGRGSKDWEHGGLLNAFAHLEGAQMGGWQGLSLDSHLEFFYGQTAATNGGMLSPTNTALTLPSANETDVVAGVNTRVKF